MASHMTISMPSEPDSRMYCVCEICVSFSGSLTMPSRNILSNSWFTKPARSPCSWCDMPPVPYTTTRRSSGKSSTARRIAWPSLKQRTPVGGGYWITFTHSGITLNGHSLGWPQVTDSGTVRP